jgi:hypothetical protein
VRTLDDILIEARAPARFELLSIDVEGHELEVLSGFDFARWRPRLILLEDHVGNLKKHRFLRAAGYRLIRRFENNGWYVPRDATIGVAPRERWDIVRKYYLGLPFRIARNASRGLRRRVRKRFIHSLGYHHALVDVELSRPAAAMPAPADVAGEREGRRNGALGGGGHAFISS